MIAKRSQFDSVELGRQMYDLAAELYPFCRSLTGPGVRQTLAHLAEFVPLEVHEVPTGTAVFDWEVPREWSIRDAYVKDASGRRVIDFRESNLHVVGYSMPVQKKLRWSELKQHLHSIVDRPGWIPYRNTFSAENWGFCLSHRKLQELEALGEQDYEICIDSSLQHGSLTYGEVFFPGESQDEVLISTHICHPSLANDNLSGIAVATFLAQELQNRETRYSYRFLFIPATIGAIAWLSQNQDSAKRIKHGWVLAGVGDAGAPTYKRSRRGNAEVDRAFEHVIKHANEQSTVLDFDPFGYDQRQFCSPGFDLPMGCLMRTPYQQYPQYHTSADNLDFICPQSLAGSWSICLSVVELLEGNLHFLNRFPYCEPRLGPRGLYQSIGSGLSARELQNALLWVLNLSDGQYSLLEIAERSKLPFAAVHQAAELLRDHDLLTETNAFPVSMNQEHESQLQTILP